MIQNKSKNPWNTISSYYDLFTEFNNSIEKPIIKKILNKTKNKSVLDAGCGTGNYSELCYRMGLKIKGIDSAKSMIFQATKKYPHINFKEMDIKKMRIKDNSFDIILCLNMLDTIRDYKKAIKELSRVLKESGQLIISIWRPLMGKGEWLKRKGKIKGYLHEDYFDNKASIESWSLQGKKLKSKTFHRTIEQYSQEFYANNLVIQRIFEPRYKGNKEEGMFKKARKMPYFMIYELKKCKNK